MELSDIIEQYEPLFKKKFGAKLLPSQLRAMSDLQRCRTPDSGEIYVQCTQCPEAHWKPMSCGHRSCPKCQNHEVSQWLERQQAKLLPVEYFMVTFTLPYELRTLAWNHQKEVYSALFTCASSTLKNFGLKPGKLEAEMGMTAVLHTHSRKLDFHPHLHVVVPGGGIDKRKKQWTKIKGKYLFNAFALAKVFRARLLETLSQQGLTVPHKLPEKWVVDCAHVGKGLPALKYLSRYLYRGVISENNIVSNNNGKVTFKYTDSKTGNTQFRILAGEDFLNLIFQHVLPKGFRRVRDYGFLHPNARKLLTLVQLVLRVFIKALKPRERPVFKCSKCQAPMKIILFRRPQGVG